VILTGRISSVSLARSGSLTLTLPLPWTSGNTFLSVATTTTRAAPESLRPAAVEIKGEFYYEWNL
jgi:hypothetical protein